YIICLIMIMCHSLLYVQFFFSSRRRHTRSKRDWSSDVCSSDLPQSLVTSPVSATSMPPQGNARDHPTSRSSGLTPWLCGNSTLRSEERRVGKECRSRRSA